MAFELQSRGSNAVAMVRAGEEAHLYSWCRDNGYVTIGWFGRPPIDIGDWSLGQLEARFRAEYPHKGESDGPGAYGNQAAQTRGLHNVADFLFNLPVGRKVMISSPDGGATVMLGEVVGSYEFHEDWDITARFDPYCHFKPVRWIGEFARKDLVAGANLPWTAQSTIWWVEDAGAIRELEEAASSHSPAGATAGLSAQSAPAPAPKSAQAEPLPQLTPLTDCDEIAAAYSNFVSQLTAGVPPLRKAVGWRSGSGEFDVYWHEDERLWCLFESDQAGNRYWCCFGPDDPNGQELLSITCEINFPFDGVNRRVGGVFLKDDDGRVFIGHSGKIGGGHEGVGKERFLKYLDDPTRTQVAWPDGTTTEMLVLGVLDTPGFVRGVATFVSEVAAFKRGVRDGTTDERELPASAQSDTDGGLGDYFPESFLGTTTFAQQSRTIEIHLAHGPVVHALRDAIESAGLAAKKNRRIDLAAVSEPDDVLTVFEVKTSLDWGSVYGAIGQLMYYGRTGDYSPKRLAAVLPEGGLSDLEDRQSSIGIDVVRYRYSDTGVEFDGLDAMLLSS